jgi:hypothetical protein
MIPLPTGMRVWLAEQMELELEELETTATEDELAAEHQKPAIAYDKISREDILADLAQSGPSVKMRRSGL